MPDAILNMRYAHYLEDFADDKGFLQATHQAGLQVEKKKALKQAREQMKGTSSSGTSRRHNERKKEGQDERNPDSNKREKETDKPRQERTESRADKCPWWGGNNHWASKGEAMRGVSAKEQEEYGQKRDDCWRCARSGHRTYECFSFSTVKGTPLSMAPWKAAAAGQKRGTENKEDEKAPATKQQKVAAAETMETDAVAPLWEESDSDF